ncbi:hypothetical protein ACFQX6_55140 [Streptosporangium lutulentum]
MSHSMHARREDGRQTPFDILANCVGELLFQLEAATPASARRRTSPSWPSTTAPS